MFVILLFYFFNQMSVSNKTWLQFCPNKVSKNNNLRYMYIEHRTTQICEEF